VRKKWWNVLSDEGRRIALIENCWAAPRQRLMSRSPFQYIEGNTESPYAFRLTSRLQLGNLFVHSLSAGNAHSLTILSWVATQDHGLAARNGTGNPSRPTPKSYVLWILRVTPLNSKI
jgi:hypothetical protein